MKKMVLTIMAAFIMTNVAMSQENKVEGRKQMTETEMAEHRTERMAKKFGLNEEQKAKLLQLNKEFAGKMPGRGFGRPQRMGRPSETPKREVRPDSLDKKHMIERVNPQEMRKNIEAYDSQLKNILNEQQFKDYMSEREKMMKRGHKLSPER